MKYSRVIRRKAPWLVSGAKRVPGIVGLVRFFRRKRSSFLTPFYRLSARLRYGSRADLYGTLALAIKHGYFDLNWYNQNQNQTFDTDAEAFADYLHKGKFSNINPGPSFDTEYYYRSNMDVYHSGRNALEHFVHKGKGEERPYAPARPRWSPTTTVAAIEPKHEFDVSSLKVAVCLHVFYSDFLDYYKACLKDFPVAVDLYISLSKKEYIPLAEKAFAGLPQIRSVTTAVVPNRGRNFGPLLVEFSDRLKEYDLFCHLHSKKSLYSGRDQTQWVDYLAEYLLKDKQVVTRVLNEFMDNPECGIYYPTSFWMMPNWVNHWLKNKPHADKFVKEWGLELDQDFIPYPVGGMFWARPEALEQLLEPSYQYDDFPEEPLPNDGSELHALERALALLVEKNGYQQMFYYPTLGELTYDQSFILASYVDSEQGVREKIQPFDTISFDVFDTLVRRRYFVPDYAKLLLGEHLFKLGKIDDAHSFVKMRNDAEFTVRKAKQFQGDVTLCETYHQLASELEWSEEQAKQFGDMEFAFDLEMIEPKDEMVDIANSFILQGKQVLVVSDTYYDSHQIIRMLKKVGLTAGYQLYVSSGLGYRKDNGSMWRYLKDDVGLDGRFVHVGDNVVADAQIPGDFGLQNLHILNPLDKWQAAGWSNPFSGENKLNKQQILKWGPLVSAFGRFPFLGE